MEYWLRDAPDVAQDGGGAGGGAGDRVSGGGGGDLSPTSWPDAMVSVSWGRGLAATATAVVVAVGTFCLCSFLRAPPIGCVGDSVNLRLLAVATTDTECGIRSQARFGY